MHLQLSATSARRRSERVSIAFPVEVAGIDLMGRRFSERTKTTTVSRYGCYIPLPRMLQSDQAIEMRRIGTNEMAVARVVAPMGLGAEGRLYGVETRESCEGLWGIRFSSALYEKLLGTMQGGASAKRDRQITYWNEGAKPLAGFSDAGFSDEAVLGKEFGESILACVNQASQALSNDAGRLFDAGQRLWCRGILSAAEAGLQVSGFGARAAHTEQRRQYCGCSRSLQRFHGEVEIR